MASNNTKGSQKKITTLQIVLTAIVVVIFGLLLIVIAEINALWFWIGQENIQSVVQSVLSDIGSLLLASVAISLLWELVGKRAFLDEILSKVRLSQDVISTGIIKITSDFQDDIDWNSLFHHVNDLDIFFLYGQTWRGTHAVRLQKAARRHVNIRVVLPDPDDDISVSELARRIVTTKEEVQKRIREAEVAFKNLKKEGAKVSIWFLPRLPLFSFYRFDHTIVFALYTNDPSQKTIPAFLLKEGGSLYEFAQAEFSAMTNENGLARPDRG